MWVLKSNYLEPDFYASLEKELLGLIEGEPNLVANLANISSWLYHSMPDLNWAGFYLWDHEAQELVLGPFQGMPACLRIRPDRGVCGAAYSQKRPLRVEDVQAFPGHIACDSNSRSELVVPMMKDGSAFGVLDLDSPKVGRFTLKDELELTRIVSLLTLKLLR